MENNHSQLITTIEQLAQVLIDRRMVAPAIFLLELSKPLIGCARELYTMTEGLQSVIFGSRAVPALKQLLSSSDQVEKLIVLLEESRLAVAAPGAEQI
ncbi:MAG: hypothetical protein ACK5GN_11400 [Pseudomonadota bacterium]|jgi:hypothetical protein